MISTKRAEVIKKKTISCLLEKKEHETIVDTEHKRVFDGCLIFVTISVRRVSAQNLALEGRFFCLLYAQTPDLA